MWTQITKPRDSCANACPFFHNAFPLFSTPTQHLSTPNTTQTGGTSNLGYWKTLFPSLITLGISSNSFTGFAPITSIPWFTTLKHLDASDNSYTSIAFVQGQLPPNLEYLDLSKNSISGGYGTWTNNFNTWLPNMKHLDFSDNGFAGSLLDLTVRYNLFLCACSICVVVCAGEKLKSAVSAPLFLVFLHPELFSELSSRADFAGVKTWLSKTAST